MTQIKLTKNELRTQEYKRKQLQKYLPTLQLKKAMLQLEVNQVSAEIETIKNEFKAHKKEIEDFQFLLSSANMEDFIDSLKIEEVKKRFENIAGVEIPHFDSILFKPLQFDLLDTPLWWDEALRQLKRLLEIEQNLLVAEERKRLLAAELRSVSIRVNLFEKILIPRTTGYIKKIKIFLGDQQLAAVSQAKVAKVKIEAAAAEKKQRVTA